MIQPGDLSSRLVPIVFSFIIIIIFLSLHNEINIRIENYLFIVGKVISIERCFRSKRLIKYSNMEVIKFYEYFSRAIHVINYTF